MIVRQERWLSPPAVRAFTPALKRSNFGWLDVTGWMQGEGWAIWNIGGVGYVFTLVNDNDEIEVLLAGGERAKECVPHWEAAMLARGRGRRCMGGSQSGPASQTSLKP